MIGPMQTPRPRRRAPWCAIAWLALALGACSQDPPPPSDPQPNVTAASAASQAPLASAAPKPEPRGDAARGKELVATFECQRCHDGIADVAPIKLESHCTHCHQAILDGRFADKPDHPRWRKNVAHLVAAPSLNGLDKRMRYEWLVGFLLEPHDLRPALEQSMPRLKLERVQARDIATYLMGSGPVSAPEVATGDAKRGAKLMQDKGCGDCHRMGGSQVFADKSVPNERETRVAVMLAPDLRHARERLDPGALIAWLLDPQSVKPGTPMPKMPMSDSEAQDIAAYVLTSELTAPPPAELPAVPKPLDREVTFAEVAERVLDKTCRHCHGNPDVAVGDGGPGNTGGFGFKGRGLELTSYERVMAGFLDDQGERQSVFIPTRDGTPRLVAAMMARYAEEAGKPNAEVRGMPLGLPPVPLDDIKLVVTWIAQGRRR
jgi:cytochrome c2